jgi:IS30 family transposase
MDAIIGYLEASLSNLKEERNRWAMMSQTSGFDVGSIHKKHIENWSQKKIALDINVSQSTIQRLLMEMTTPHCHYGITKLHGRGKRHTHRANIHRP